MTPHCVHSTIFTTKCKRHLNPLVCIVNGYNNTDTAEEEETEEEETEFMRVTYLSECAKALASV